MAESAKRAENKQAVSMLKVQGVIALVFGGLGALLGLLLMSIFAIALGQAYSDNDVVEFFIWFVVSIFFILLPHIYLIISGIILIRQPEPKLARLLTIINLIVGAMSNYIVLAFAIISLVQAKDYEEGYKSLQAKE